MRPAVRRNRSLSSLKEEMMFTTNSIARSARNDSDTISPETAARLRRAGYYDGEPVPRLGHHWANQPSSVKGRTLRWRSKYQVNS